MCGFCESLADKNKEIRWFIRSAYADDNICEFINGTNCDKCDECCANFTINGYIHEDNMMVGVQYHQKNNSHKWRKGNNPSI